MFDLFQSAAAVYIRYNDVRVIHELVHFVARSDGFQISSVDGIIGLTNLRSLDDAGCNFL